MIGYMCISGIIWGLIRRNQGCYCFKIPRIYFEEPNVDEDIGPFHEVLSKGDRIYSIAEELNGRMYGINRILPHAFEDLQKPSQLKEGAIHMTGVHTYDILRNPAYS
jgi:hypothetical protein